MRLVLRSSTARLGRLLGALVAAVCTAAAAPASAQVLEVDLRGMVFHEPSEKSQMTVYNPGIGLAVSPWDFLTVRADYEADIVSGATEPVKAGPLSSPDVISQASIDDTRHLVSGGFTIDRKNTALTATYTYGVESDYKSQAISVVGSTEFLQRNTRIEISYARGFDKVCNKAYRPTIHPSARTPLDSSAGCFTDADDRQADDIDLDTFGAGWTQSWTPVLTTQLVFTGGIQHGFLGNPYRGVVIGATGQVAQEHHPENRARVAAGLRVKYFIRGFDTVVGVSVRGYRDTWDVLSQTYQLEAERYMLPWLRLAVKGRYYNQTSALFWSDDYTGGEPVYGPRGQYWSGDRELSPFKSFLLGGRVLAGWKGAKGNRIAGLLLDAGASVSLDIIKTNLEDFTLAGQPPDDTTAFVLGVGLHGGF